MRKKFFLMTGWLFLSCIAMMAQAPGYLTSQEAEVYNQHEAEVKAVAKILTGDQLSELNTKYTIALDYQTPLKQLIEERETRMSIYNFIFPEDDLARYKAKQKVKKEYLNKQDQALLLSGANATTKNYFLALKFKDRLSLTQIQVDSIVAKAVEVNRLLERRPMANVWAHELKTFNAVLSEKQMDSYLAIKNQAKARRNTFTIWKILKDNKMVTDIDSAATVGQLYYYYSNIEKANDLYVANDSLKKSALNAINTNAPLAMKRYWAHRKLSRIKNTYGGTYAW